MDIIGDADEQEPARPEREVIGWRAVVRPADLLHSLLDGLVALGAAIALAAVSLVIVLYVAISHFHGGPGDFFALAVWLTGASLGVPLRSVVSFSEPSEHYKAVTVTDLRVIAWLLTVVMLVLVFRLVRRRERARPSAGLAQSVVRALLTALVATLGLLVLALVTTRASVFGYPFGLESITGGHVGSRIGLEPGFVFVGPLLLTAVAALAGAAPAIPPPRRRTDELARWSLVLRQTWRQLLITGVLAGTALLVYGSVEAVQHTGGRFTVLVVIGLVLMLPNLAIYGTLGGFGTTFYVTQRATGPGSGSGLDRVSRSIGIFDSFRPWVVWLLLAAAVVGTLLPALRARRAVRAGRLGGADYPLSGVWRAALAGLLAALAWVLLGAFSYSTSASGTLGHLTSLSESAGPSLLAAAGLTAAWLSLGYLATSIAVGSGGA